MNAALGQWECPYCNGLSDKVYRCSECGHDLTDDVGSRRAVCDVCGGPQPYIIQATLHDEGGGGASTVRVCRECLRIARGTREGCTTHSRSLGDPADGYRRPAQLVVEGHQGLSVCGDCRAAILGGSR